MCSCAHCHLLLLSRRPGLTGLDVVATWHPTREVSCAQEKPRLVGALPREGRSEQPCKAQVAATLALTTTLSATSHAPPSLGSALTVPTPLPNCYCLLPHDRYNCQAITTTGRQENTGPIITLDTDRDPFFATTPGSPHSQPLCTCVTEFCLTSNVSLQLPRPTERSGSQRDPASGCEPLGP